MCARVWVFGALAQKSNGKKLGKLSQGRPLAALSVCPGEILASEASGRYFTGLRVRAYFFSRIDTHDLLYLGGLQSGCPARHRPVIGATTRRAYETEISAGKGSWSANHRAF